MARVNLDEGVWEMTELLAREMEWEEEKALYRIATLYRKTQALQIVEASEKDLAFWFKPTPSERPKLIPALLAARVVKESEGGLYRIRGNKHHIDNVQQKKTTAQKNGEKGGRPKKKTDDETDVGLEEEPTLVSDENPNGNQSDNPARNPNTVQLSAVQSNSTQSNTHTAAGGPPGLSACAEAWLGTLRWHGILRDRLGQGEDLEIARAIKRLKGDAEEVRFAIIGGRFEEGGPTYEPANHCKLTRYLDSKKLQGFADLGRKAQDTAWVETWIVAREERRKGGKGGPPDDEPTVADLRGEIGAGGGR